MQYKIAQKTIDKLNSVRNTDPNSFYYSITILRSWGWTLQDIADAFFVSKSAVASWEKTGDKVHEVNSVVFTTHDIDIKPEIARMTSTGLKKERVVFDVNDMLEVSKLTAEARVVSKNTSLNAPSRKSAARLEELLLNLNNQGISMARLAAAAGVSRRAIAQRINKARIAEKIDT